jgi:2'-5' RNA ligase
MKRTENYNKNEALYFIALVPENPVQDEIMRFKNTAKINFRSSKSLNSPTHITIIPPFSISGNNQQKLENDLEKAVTNQSSLAINLNGFGHFGNRVIYVNIKTDEKITDLYSKVFKIFQPYFDDKNMRNDKFHPHITVAFKDLLPEMFEVAWEYFSGKTYEREAIIDGITLLKLENKKWIEVKRIIFPIKF